MATILVIDDRLDVLDLAKQALGGVGHTVYGALNGAEGIALARARKPDLVLVDFFMPGLNGASVGHWLAEFRGERHYPIILYSSMDTESLKYASTKFDGAIQKNGDTDLLVTSVTAYLARAAN